MWDLPAGKWWGPKEVQPIVALHGRQDNAGTFDTLMPLMPDISVLCLDMPGHGLSSHYPKNQYYYVYYDGVIFLRKVIKYFKWEKVSEWINLSHTQSIILTNLMLKNLSNKSCLYQFTASRISVTLLAFVWHLRCVAFKHMLIN